MFISLFIYMRKPSSQQTRGQRSETSTLQDKNQPFDYFKFNLVFFNLTYIYNKQLTYGKFNN